MMYVYARSSDSLKYLLGIFFLILKYHFDFAKFGQMKKINFRAEFGLKCKNKIK